MVDVKIGLEVHGYLDMSDSGKKLFCDCTMDSEAKPNSNICPICTGQPGCKPMNTNEEAIRKMIAIASFLGCKINTELLFQRKHYSWPDMPVGFQKTMSGTYAVPTGVKGEFEGINITEIHLEEDPAAWDPVSGKVDYNRAGSPLVEIVTEPEFTSSQQVRAWLKKLVTALSYIKALNEGGIKADTNVSIGPKFDRVEIKNVNSIKSIAKAIEYEAARQEKEISEGKKIKQETRRWDDKKEETQFMRSKENAIDYMFIPEPDLPIIEVSQDSIKKVQSGLPEKPGEKIEKFTKRGVEQIDAEVLASELMLAELFEKVAVEVDPALAARWLRRELRRVLNYNKKSIDQVELDEKRIIELLAMVERREITDRTAQKLMEKILEKDFSPRKYVEEEGLKVVSDTGAIEKACKEAIDENPDVVKEIKGGNKKATQFIFGHVMKKTKGQASPQEIHKILEKLLG